MLKLHFQNLGFGFNSKPTLYIHVQPLQLGVAGIRMPPCHGISDEKHIVNRVGALTLGVTFMKTCFAEIELCSL